MSHLGDIAQTIPLVHALRAKWPSVRLAWAVQPEFAGLIEPLVDEVIPFGRRDGAGAWPAIRRAMRQFAPDLAIDAQGNWKSAAAARLSGAPVRVGFSRRRWQEPMAARVFGIRTAEVQGRGGMAGPHLVERILGLGEALTGSASTRMDAAVTDEERSEASRILGKAAGERSKEPGIDVVLHPGVPGDPRSWSQGNYRDLGQQLLAAGRRVLVLTGPGESEVGAWIKGELPGAVHLVGQRGLRPLAALFETLAANGAQIVCGDSGPAHVAASAGLPVVLIAGPENPACTGPWPVPAPWAIEGPGASPHRVAGTWNVASPTDWNPRPTAETTVECALQALAKPRPAALPDSHSLDGRGPGS